jgi:hypothetical protein
VAKIYVMIGEPSPDEPTWPFPPWRLTAKNKFTEGEWWYHVAPIVFARDEKTGEVDGYVIDMAVNKNNPIKASDWIKAFWTQDFPIHFDTTYADVYDPPEQSYYPIPTEFSREKFDSYLPEARQTNQEYGAALKQIKDHYYAHHPDEKPEDEA